MTQDKCGLGHIYTPPGRAGPAERQERRGGELTGWGVGLCTCRDDLPQKALFAVIAQNCGREGLHIMTAPTALVHESCGTGHITVGGTDMTSGMPSQSPRMGSTGDNLEPSPWHHEPV